jgi:hypothetical protein
MADATGVGSLIVCVRRNMKTFTCFLILSLCIAVFSGCSQPSYRSTASASSGPPLPLDVPVAAESSNYSNVVATANELVSKAGLKWGHLLEVRWQPAPLNRYLVIYATPQSELGYAGHRSVHVETNWHAWFTPRL